MSKFYTVLTVFPIGEPWGEGNKNQTYWCQVEGLEEAVKITKQTELQPGDQVYGDLLTDDGKPFYSAKGKPFFKYKSAKIPEGTARPASAPRASAPVDMSQAAPTWFLPYGNMIRGIWDEVKPNDTLEGVKGTKSSQTSLDDSTEGISETDGGLKVAGEPIDPDLAKKMDDMFGPDEE